MREVKWAESKDHGRDQDSRYRTEFADRYSLKQSSISDLLIDSPDKAVQNVKYQETCETLLIINQFAYLEGVPFLVET